MPTRPDLRDITTGVKDALADCDRDTLLDILTFVMKEYVVDGPPPMLMHQTESFADLNRLTFAQLIIALQTRLDLPELGLFAVDGEQVSVRIGGVMQALGRGPAAAAPAAELPRPSAGVRVVETPTRPAPSAAPAAPMPPGAMVTERAAPPPARGLSLRGRPGGAMAAEGGDAAPPPAAAPAPAPAAPAAAAPPATPERRDDPAASGDDASARFSLLELD
ncbi:MAG: hypothetical protein JNK64_30415 [Myxococcales bacterium]|nr:hypothetical protein [Myxococcales bacterium]